VFDVRLVPCSKADDRWHDVMVPEVGSLATVTVDTFRGSFASTVEASALPHARLTLLIERGSGTSSVGGVPLRALVVGLRSRPVQFEQCGDIECVEMRLSPSLALAIGLGPGDLHDSVEPLQQLFGRRADSLGEQLASTVAADRPGLLRDAISAEAVGRRPTRDIDALRALERADLRSTVGDIVSDVGGTRSALLRRVASTLGMTPKQYLMLRRFEHGADLLSAGQTIADAASCAGYVDQSHFHRHVQRFAQSTPSQLARQINATYVQDGDSRVVSGRRGPLVARMSST
jgi:AraC-like DNA-binding protein